MPLGGRNAMNIAQYFADRDAARAALDRYNHVFAQQNHWSPEHKLDMYQAGATAFDTTRDLRKRQEAFDLIYANLKGGWQVFRKAQQYWSPSQVFDVLTNNPACAACSRDAGLTLVLLTDERARAAVAECLAAIRPLTTLKHNNASPMAMSKFLYFFNPKLFPIYDNWAIEGQVLKRFNHDWKSFQGVAAGPDIAYYFRYVLWVSTIMADSQPGVMQEFAQWF
jgi:hypothetical protein